MKKTLLVLLLALALVLSFGTMALAAEVEVGTATDLQNAINDADAGDTIKLTANIEATNAIVIPAGTKVTIDLAGHRLWGVDPKDDPIADATKLIENKGDLTIDDSVGGGIITSSATNPDTVWAPGFPTYANNTINNYGNLTINGGTIECTTNGGANYAIDNYGGTVTINGGKVVHSNNNVAIRQYVSNDNGNSIIINGGEVSGKRAIWMHLPGSTNTAARPASIEVNGGTLNSTDDDGYNLAIYVYSFGDGFNGVEIEITDGTIDGVVAMDGGSTNGGEGASKLVITGGDFKDEVFTYSDEENIDVYGGSFAEELAPEYLASGVEMEMDVNGNYVTKGSVYIGAKDYATLADAVDAAGDGDVITLTESISGSGVVINKSVTIDFDGNKYTFVAPAVGSTGTESNGFQILKNNTVVLKNGTLEVAESAKDKFYILIQNYADLSLINMIIDGTNLDKYSTTDGDSYAVSNNNGDIVIEKSTITANDDGALAFAFDVCDYTYYDGVSVTVKDSTINGNVEMTTKKAADATSADLFFVGNTSVSGNVSADATVQAAIAAGKSALAKTAEASVTLPVITGAVSNAVATANGVPYDSLQAAVNAGGTVELLTDVTVTTTPVLTIANDVTINGNGFTLKQNSNTTDDRVVQINGGDVTINDLTVLNPDGSYSRGINIAADTCTVTLNNVKVDVKYYAINQPSSSKNVTVNINDSWVRGYSAINLWGDDTVVNVKNSTLLGTNLGGDSEGFATIVLNRMAENTVVNVDKDSSIFIGSPSKHAASLRALGVELNAEEGVAVGYYEEATDGSINMTQAVDLAEATRVINFVVSGREADGLLFDTLEDALQSADAGDTIKMIRNTEGAGVVFPSDTDITIDFGGFTYTFIAPPVGSTGTETLGFQLLKDSDITLQNGTLQVAPEAAEEFAMLIQNYANLTLIDMVLDGTYLDHTTYSYVLSNNCGTTALLGDTSIKANDSGDANAFDVYNYPPYAVPSVTVATSGTIDGDVEYSEGTTFIVEAGRFNDLDVLDHLVDGSDVALFGKLTANRSFDIPSGAKVTVEKGASLAMGEYSLNLADGAALVNKGIISELGEYTVALNAKEDKTYVPGQTVTYELTLDCASDYATVGDMVLSLGYDTALLEAGTMTAKTITLNDGTTTVTPKIEEVNGEIIVYFDYDDSYEMLEKGLDADETVVLAELSFTVLDGGQKDYTIGGFALDAENSAITAAGYDESAAISFTADEVAVYVVKINVPSSNYYTVTIDSAVNVYEGINYLLPDEDLKFTVKDLTEGYIVTKVAYKVSGAENVLPLPSADPQTYTVANELLTATPVDIIVEVIEAFSNVKVFTEADATNGNGVVYSLFSAVTGDSTLVLVDLPDTYSLVMKNASTWNQIVKLPVNSKYGASHAVLISKADLLALVPAGATATEDVLTQAAKDYLTVNFAVVDTTAALNYLAIVYDMNTNGKDNHKLLDVQAAYDFMTISSGYYWTPTTALVLKADVVASTVTNADELLYGADTPASQDGKITWHDIYVFLDYANPLR